MFEIIEIKEDRWDEIVRSFADYDVYYLSGYVKGFQIHGDGDPILLYYSSDYLRAVCALFRRELEGGGFDVITPYGYGGFIFDGELHSDNMTQFQAHFYAFMQYNGIVSGFFRYHPILKNAEVVRSVLPIIDLGRTIDINLTSKDVVFENLTSKNRNTIRKAQKNGVTVSFGRGMDLLDQFIPIYNGTMDKDQASKYYYFQRDFYISLDEDLKNNYLVFYASYEGKIIAASIILFANRWMHYHLSGSLMEYRHLAPTNLLLFQAALWGAENGLEQFHLGGGFGSGEDNLYKFKASFNRQSSNQFSIGKMIFDLTRYNELVDLRKARDLEFDIHSHFFPLYRS